MEEFSNTKLHLFTAKLAELTSLYGEVLDRIFASEKYTEVVDRYYYTVFLKIYMVLDGISVQVYNLYNKQHFGYTVALQLRTAMLDAMSLFYVLDVIDDHEEQVRRVNAIMADHIKYARKEMSPADITKVQRDFSALFD